SSFLESLEFPVSEVDEASLKEKKGGGRPEFWEMVFWWTRKPLISARSIIAGLLLPEDTNPRIFKEVVRLNSLKTPHRENPKIPQDLRSKAASLRLLDPFAGFGSIPLEAVRLGVGEVVAAELLPTAYVFLKAVLEIPKWVTDERLKNELLNDLESWGKWILNKLREDPDIKELYDDETAVYIGTWEIKCHYCNKYTPLVGNWWLARVKSGEDKYERLAWMEPRKTGDEIRIVVRDLNKELGKNTIKAKMEDEEIKTDKETYRVPEPNITARGNIAKCLHCNNTQPGKGDEWRVKKALKEWNEKLEKYLTGEIRLEELKQATARPKILVKAKTTNKNLEFEPATQQDNEKLWKALEKLKQMWGDPDIPTEPIPEYENRRITPVLGAISWYQFFNPRQLLTLVKLVKLIREASRRVEEEKLEQGWDKQKAHKYAEAIITYLAIALVNHVRHNCLVTSIEPTAKFIAHALAFRGIAMTWNWIEELPNANIVGSYIRSLNSVIEGLQYLINAVSGSSSRVEVVLDDAKVLGKLDANEKFDLIVTDPPYLDDVAYSELSDFYYVWLKRALSDSDGFVLTPRFFAEAFFECLDNGCSKFSEVRTQWEVFASREVSASEGRARHFGLGSSVEFFKKGLVDSFKRLRGLLRGGGVLVTYYAHTSPEAWEALLEAGWRGAGLRVSRAFPVTTESEERVTARGKVVLDSSIVVVWREGLGGEELLQRAHLMALNEATETVKKVLERGVKPDFNLFLESLSTVLSVYTRYSRLIPDKSVSELVKNHIFPAAIQAMVRGAGVFVGVSTSFSPESSSYIVVKLVSRPGNYSRFRRAVIDRDFASVLGAVGGLDVSKIISLNILGRYGDELELLEPKASVGVDEASLRKSFEELLLEKNISLRNPVFKTPIDVLHYIEYKALELGRDEFKNFIEGLKGKTVGVDEALNIARVFARVLPSGDPERRACSRILSHLGELTLR
ncbi:MAG: DUF1156 domain-containing protein, partial [Zestosphaera sp.]